MSTTNVGPCHHCGGRPAAQWARLATGAEAAAQRVEIQAMVGHAVDDAYIAERYGPLRTAVFGCEQHDLSPAPADQTPDAAAAAGQAGMELRSIVHRADCGGHGQCACVPG